MTDWPLFVLGMLTGAGLVGLIVGYLIRDDLRRP